MVRDDASVLLDHERRNPESSCPQLSRHPRLNATATTKAWMAGMNPAMTRCANFSSSSGAGRDYLHRHCEPTGPHEVRPDDRLREAIQRNSSRKGLDCFVADAPRNDGDRSEKACRTPHRIIAKFTQATPVMVMCLDGEATRVPGAMQRVTLLCRTGTIANSAYGTAPDQRRDTECRSASGARHPGICPGRIIC
jgi:hypothetical protein